MSEFGDDVTNEQMLEGWIATLPERLRGFVCRPTEPWVTADASGLDHDHGHTMCLFVNLAADEIENLRGRLRKAQAGLLAIAAAFDEAADRVEGGMDGNEAADLMAQSVTKALDEIRGSDG